MKDFFKGFAKKAETVADTQMAAAANSIRGAFGSKPATPPPPPAAPTSSLAQSISSGLTSLMGGK